MSTGVSAHLLRARETLHGRRERRDDASARRERGSFRAVQTGLPRLALLCACLACFGCARARAPRVPPSPQVDAQQLYETGQTYRARGDLTRAEQYFVSALRAGHGPRETTCALVSVTLHASRLRSALIYAAPYLADHPGDVPLRQLVASVHLALGELAQAEEQLRRALSLDAQRPEAHYLLSVVLARRDARADELEEPLARYLELAPKGPHAEEVRAALDNLRTGELDAQREPAHAAN